MKDHLLASGVLLGLGTGLVLAGAWCLLAIATLGVWLSTTPIWFIGLPLAIAAGIGLVGLAMYLFLVIIAAIEILFLGPDTA
jgi:hypothetical protein